MSAINFIRKDIQKEAMDAAFMDLTTQIQSLKKQNSHILLKLNEETKRNVELTKLLRNRRPFKRDATGEVVFPGKKEMKFKLDVMTNEILKLKRVLNGFQRDRCQFGLTRELLSVKCSESELKKNPQDLKKSQLIKKLSEQYEKMNDRFDESLMKISNYRVELDEVKHQLDMNEKRLEEKQVDFVEANLKLTQIELDNTNESNKKDGLNLKNKLNELDNSSDDLKSMIDLQMNELKIKNKQYMDAIHEKEYQSIRNDNLCKEKTRLTMEFETEFNRVKNYFKKRIEHLEHLPSVLQAFQEQLAIQKELKTSVENEVEILSKKLKSITEDSCKHFKTDSRQLMKLKNQNISLKMEKESMETVLENIEHCYKVTKQKKIELNSRLNDIKIKTEMKINELRSNFKRPTEEYLCSIEILQNKIAKIEANSSFEDEKQKLLSSVLHEPIEALNNVLRNAQGQITEIENLQKYLSFT